MSSLKTTDTIGPRKRLLPLAVKQYALMGALLGVLMLFLVYPILLTVKGAFVDGSGGFTLSNFALVFSDPNVLTGFVNAFLIATVTTLLCVVIALPLAWCSAKYKYPGKGIFNALILVPLILPPFVGAIGMQKILGNYGSLNSLISWLGLTDGPIDVMANAKFWGVVIVEALHLYPIMYLNATASLANLDPALDEAAENLGAGAWARFRKITLPLIRSGLFAGGTIVFIWSLTELGTPLVFEFSNVTPVQIFNGLKEVESSVEPYVLTVALLFGAIMTYVLGKLVFGGKAYAMYAKASRAGGELKLRGTTGWLVTGGFVFVTILALIPHLGVMLTSVAEPSAWYKTVLPEALTASHYEQALTNPLAVTSIKNSLWLSGTAVVMNVLMGILVAYIVVRTTIKGRGLLDALCMLPLAVPGLVMAFGYVSLSLELSDWWIFSADGPLNLTILGATPNPVPLLIVAYAIRRLPYVVRAVASGLEQTSGELEEAAVNLGSTRFGAVRRVIVPLIMANIIAGALLAFSFAMLEVSDSLILAQQSKHFPITRALYEYLNRLGDGKYIASAMGVWGMALLTVTLVGASILIGKKMGSIFRV